jgi:hypothetical protein
MTEKLTAAREAEIRDACKHERRHPFGRTPVRYGSFEVERCKDCKAWRTTSHSPGQWRDGKVPRSTQKQYPPMNALDQREYVKQRVVVDPATGCWIWQRSAGARGYGFANIRGRKILAHRLSYELFVGPIPPEINGQHVCVCHQCDTPSCVKPEHLWLGTDGDNNADKVAKQRHAVGSRCGRSKLTEAQVAEIRRQKGKRLNRELAAEYGVSDVVISAIQRGKIWRHVTGGEAA